MVLRNLDLVKSRAVMFAINPFYVIEEPKWCPVSAKREIPGEESKSKGSTGRQGLPGLLKYASQKQS